MKFIGLLFVAIGFAFASPAFAQENWRDNSRFLEYRLVNPYGAGLSEQEAAASDKAKPPIANAKWDHEPCALAYQYQYSLARLPEDLNAAKAKIAESIVLFRSEGLADDQLAKSRQQALSELASAEAEVRRRAASFDRNIPKCQGVYYRPAVEQVCDRIGADENNRFCRAMTQGGLAGVSFSEDRAALAYSLAWNYVGAVRTRGFDFLIDNGWRSWVTGNKIPADIKRPLLRTVIGSDGRIRSTIYSAAEFERDMLDWMGKGGVMVVSSKVEKLKLTNSARPEKDTARFGTFQFNFELVRELADNFNADQTAVLKSIATDIGVKPLVGEFLQYPRLHFEMYAYDVFLREHMGRFSVRFWDGTVHPLENAAVMGQAPDGMPQMSSYNSYVTLATMIPTASDIALLTHADAKDILFEVEMMVEDGKIDAVTFEYGLHGATGDFRDYVADIFRKSDQSLVAIAAKAKETSDRLAREKAETDAKQAVANAQFRVRQQAKLKATLQEASAVLANERPAPHGCGNFPSYDDLRQRAAATNNAEATAVQACMRSWYGRANVAKAKLSRISSTLWEFRRTADADLMRDRIYDIKKQWDNYIQSGIEEINRFEERVADNNIRVANRNAQSASASTPAYKAPQYRRRRAAPSRYSDNGGSGGMTPKERFLTYGIQMPEYRPVEIPPPPSGYLSSGWY